MLSQETLYTRVRNIKHLYKMLLWIPLFIYFLYIGGGGRSNPDLWPSKECFYQLGYLATITNP